MLVTFSYGFIAFVVLIIISCLIEELCPGEFGGFSSIAIAALFIVFILLLGLLVRFVLKV